MRIYENMYQIIKQSRLLLRWNQTIISSIKNFDPGRRWFYKTIGSDYPLQSA